MLYWSGRCPLTGISDPALFRAAHIISWADCPSDSERLNANNGLLLSAIWDAASDAALVSFSEDGRPIGSPCLTGEAAEALRISAAPAISSLTPGHRERLAGHRVTTFKRLP